MRRRAPLVLSLLALAVAILGWTPAGEAAQDWVKRALYAKNAGKVNGIKASLTPQPGRLLALDANGQFPASVIPTGSGGGGPPGPPGPSDAYSTSRNGSIAILGPWTTIATLSLPQAGAYVVFAKAEVGNAHASARGVADCLLTAGNDSDRTMSVLEPGSQGTDAATIALHLGHEFAGPGTVTLECNDFVGGTVSARNVKVTAIRVGTLTNTPG